LKTDFFDNGDIVSYTKTGESGMIMRVHRDHWGCRCEVKLHNPDRKLWISSDQLRLLCPSRYSL
jgi:hypothetical protein